MVERARQQPGPGAADPPSPARLVLLSFLMLFVELGLIRWSGAYIVYLSFFTNFVLLASFLGVGVGFLRARASGDLFRCFPRPARAGGPLPRDLPRAGRARRRPPPVRRRLRMAGPAEVALARHRVRPGLPDHGCDRRGGGAALRPVRAARGVPMGHPREPPRDRGLLRAVVPPRVSLRLGRGRGGDLPRRGSAAARDPDRASRGRGGPPRRAVLRAEHAVVAVLPDHHARVGGRTGASRSA